MATPSAGCAQGSLWLVGGIALSATISFWRFLTFSEFFFYFKNILGICCCFSSLIFVFLLLLLSLFLKQDWSSEFADFEFYFLDCFLQVAASSLQMEVWRSISRSGTCLEPFVENVGAMFVNVIWM